MTKIETNISELFDICEEFNFSTKSVDMSKQYYMSVETTKKAYKLFSELETKISLLGTKDLVQDIKSRDMVIKLLFIIFKSLYICQEYGIMLYQDARCLNSTILAVKMMKEKNYYNKFSQSHTFYRNDIVFTGVRTNGGFSTGLMGGICKLHPTNMQSLVRCLVATLEHSEIHSMPVPLYMERFEQDVFYYLKYAKGNDKVYLDFI